MVLFLVAWSAGSLAPCQQANRSAPSQEINETFQARCSTCHAEHGEGSEVGASLNVPDLRSIEVQRNDDAFLRQVITKGKGNMPRFGRDFSGKEIDAIIQLVRSFATESNEKSQAQTSRR